MNKLFSLLIAALFVCATCGAKARTRVQPEPQSKFRSNLNALIKATTVPSGFELLKQMELSRGVWRCTLELDGFLPTVEEEMYNPAGELQVSAVSVTPDAQKNVRMLLLKGIPGYTMKDSDNDKSVAIDRTKELRRVVFTKIDKSVESNVTVIFNAHQYASVQLLIEAW